jgi:hypothetical protein
MDTTTAESEIINKALSYRYTITDLCKIFSMSKPRIHRILENNNYNFDFSRWSTRCIKRGLALESIDAAAKDAVNSTKTYSDISRETGISIAIIKQYMAYKNMYVSDSEIKKRQKAWNAGLNKKSDKRVEDAARTLSNNKGGNKKNVWSEELSKPVKMYHYVWFRETGYWPNSKSDEQIHHIDGNADNNDISNLVLLKRDMHTKIHKQSEKLGLELIRLGFVKFDKESLTFDESELWKILEKSKV